MAKRHVKIFERLTHTYIHSEIKEKGEAQFREKFPHSLKGERQCHSPKHTTPHARFITSLKLTVILRRGKSCAEIGFKRNAPRISVMLLPHPSPVRIRFCEKSFKRWKSADSCAEEREMTKERLFCQELKTVGGEKI